jgi:hypothetical protein
VERPEDELRRVCDFIGIPYDPRMMDYPKKPANLDRINTLHPDRLHTNLREYQINQDIFDGRGRWKKELSPDHDQHLRENPSFLRIMEELGYPMDSSPIQCSPPTV